MKKSLLLALSALTVTFAANAVNVDQTFTVTATLAAKCRTQAGQNPNVNFGLYTAFGNAANTAPTADIFFECSRNFAPTGVSLDAPGGTVKGIAYTVTVGAGALSGASGSGNNNSDVYKYVVTGGITAGEAGDNTASGTDTRTLTITY